MFSKLRKLVGKDEERRGADGMQGQGEIRMNSAVRALQPQLQRKFGRGVQYNMVGGLEQSYSILRLFCKSLETWSEMWRKKCLKICDGRSFFNQSIGCSSSNFLPFLLS
jgi:hypothetical protein